MEPSPRSTLVDMTREVPRSATFAANGVIQTAPNTPRVGRLGVCVRVLLGIGLIYLVTMEEGTLKWDAEGRDLLLGLVVFPAVMVGVGGLAVLAKRPLQVVGPGGVVLNGALIIALLTNDATADPALVFYGVSLLVAAVRRAPGCEMTVISNLVLRRDDQVGCPVLAPLDEVEISGGVGGRDSQASIKAFGLHIVVCIGLIAVLAWRLL